MQLRNIPERYFEKQHRSITARRERGIAWAGGRQREPFGAILKLADDFCDNINAFIN